MDLSVIESANIADVLATMDVYGKRQNRDNNKILVLVCLGTGGNRQSSPIAGAMKSLARKYGWYGIAVVEVEIDNDQIKNQGWTVDEFTKKY
jgi:hypothetical protein